MNYLGKWFHQLINPHCDYCVDCVSCKVLKEQLELANIEKTKLLNALLAVTNPPVKEEIIPTEIKRELSPKNIPWRIKRQMLEEEDRARAKIMNNVNKDINKANEELEKELEIVAAKSEAELKLG